MTLVTEGRYNSQNKKKNKTMYFTCCFIFWCTSHNIVCNECTALYSNLLINLLAHTVEVHIKFDLSNINLLKTCVIYKSIHNELQ